MEKIIFTVTNDLCFDQRMIRICTSLSKAGYRVLLLGRKKPDSPALSNYSFQQRRLNCFFNRGKLFYIEYNFRLFFFLLFHPFDALCSIDLDTILPGLWASKIKGKVRLFDAHEYFTEVPEVIRRKSVKKIWELIANYAIPKFEHAYTVGEELANIFKKKYGRHFEVIRNVPFSQSETINPTAPPAVLYQGALNEGRGLEQCIEAMLQIEGAQLWLAGEGDLSAHLRQLVQANELGHKIKFLGYLKPEALKTVTLQARIGINLLENNGQSYYYSLANKAFDYIQAGLPSIQMDFPEYRKLQENYQVFQLITNLEIDSIVAAINKLLTDQAQYKILHSNCLKARTQLNWEMEEVKLLNFYENIFKQSQA